MIRFYQRIHEKQRQVLKQLEQTRRVVTESTIQIIFATFYSSILQNSEKRLQWLKIITNNMNNNNNIVNNNTNNNIQQEQQYYDNNNNNNNNMNTNNK
eukprot:UN03261